MNLPHMWVEFMFAMIYLSYVPYLLVRKKVHMHSTDTGGEGSLIRVKPQLNPEDIHVHCKFKSII